MFGKNKHQHQAKKYNCLKCQYDALIKEGKTLIEVWDKQPPTPPRLVEIQKALAKLQTGIEKHKNDAELRFCADHPEIFDFLPIEM